MPGILENNDRLQFRQAATSLVNQCEVLSYGKRLIDMLVELFLWRWDWERIHPKVATEVPVDLATSISVDENGIPLYETTICYCGILQAGQLLFYNAALLRVLELANDWNVQDAPLRALVKLSNRDRPLCSNPLVLPHETLSPMEAVSEICRSTDYCLQDPHAAVGAMSLMLPLDALLRSPQVSREKSWLSRTTKTVAVLCGTGTFERVDCIDHLAKHIKR